jgi:hypothetical protein
MTTPAAVTAPAAAGAQAPARRPRRLRRPQVTPATLLGYLAVLVAAGATLKTTRGLFLQQDANFDLKHYHSYLGWSLFNGGITRDLHPAEVGSYLNPALDALNYIALSILPAAVGTSLLLLIQLSSAIPLYLIARMLMPTWPRAVAVATSVLSLGGALVTSEWGTTFGDLTSAPLVLWGLWALVSATATSGWRLFAAGVLIGAAAGLKMTNATYGVASVVLACLLLPRVWPLLRYGAGLAVGFFVAAGPWMVVMWEQNRNPVFPLLNAQFKSPYAQPLTARDGRFGADSLGDLLMYPFKLVAAPAGFSSELPSSDWRWPIWAFTVVLAGVFLLLQLPGSPLSKESLPRSWSVRTPSFRSLLALQVFCVVAFAVWAMVFGIQRYAISIELIIVPLIVATLALLTAHRAVLMGLVIIFALGLGMNTVTLNWGRMDMPSGPAIPEGSVTALQKYDGIILGPTPPISYVAVAVGGEPSAGTRPDWFSKPFSDADLRRGMERMPDGRIGVLLRADAGDPKGPADMAAAWYGRRATGSCTPVPVPFYEVMLVCETVAK